MAVLATSRLARGAGKSPFRFGMLTDAHYADYESRGNRYYRQSLGKLRECVERMNEEEVAFLVELGDFNDGAGKPAEEDALRYLGDVEAEFTRFNGPRYHVLGNHNMDALSKPQVLGCIENTGIDPARSYYSFNRGGLHSVVLDPNFRGDGAPYDRGDFRWTDANIPAAQIEWLKKDLEAARKPTIVFLHQRLDGEGGVYVNNADAVRKVLEASGNTLAVFQGHHHAGAHG
ncbi:MAG: metallophosphoesterase, partial [Pirellulaceae bacterium]